MFSEDINRKINGVVKVDENVDDVLIQELKEYVITKELKKHFITFFNTYDDSFQTPTSDIGVWISGFFGSGKSHFLKMLSYLMENKEVQGIRTVERFRKKFSDDPATFMLIDDATKGHTDTILFNIDIEGFINKDKTAVLRVFAKMFYNYLGFYGEDLKVAKLEQFIARKGKTEEFRRVFEEKNGESWLSSRDAFAFFEDDIVATLKQVLGMSEQAARNWFNGSENVEISISQLVSEMKDYVDSQPADFRLLFMIDEVGQYVGADTNLLLNLQSLVEEIGSKCAGKVWVVCTGQEAIDEIIKARENEFSRIQARFKTRLSLSSSSADEVIQKRILQKTSEAEACLTKVYAENDSVLRNLFTFMDAVSDIKGYGGPTEFTRNFPFVPYQFILMQKVFTEIRKHGNSGKHLSGGERSMLSGFQEAAQELEAKDEYALAPFYLFYDTVHTFLDSSIRRVIERCERAAADIENAGIEPQDVKVLKLLYLIRYVDDVKANLDNIVILMADDIRLDKIVMRKNIQESLDRLLRQNYIGCSGGIYSFLTDEEQDIQRDIYRNTNVDTSEIVERIGNMISGDIYPNKKFRHEKYDFTFDTMVDTRVIGSTTGAMQLHILTVATDEAEKSDLHLLTDSSDKAIIVLGDTPYYEWLERAMKVRKYVKQRNITQLPKSVQDIIRTHQEEATRLEITATAELRKSIETAEFYVDGEHIEIKKGDAKAKIDQALDYLVTHVYSSLGLIEENAESDADITAILNGTIPHLDGTEPNRDAAAKVEEYLEMQSNRNLPTSMADVQNRYQGIPYGWREIDIAAVVAQLIHDQKVTIKYGGETIQPTDPNLPDMLRKKGEIGKTAISKRQAVSLQKIREVRDFLREYFDEMDVPSDEDGLVAHIIAKFTAEQQHYEELYARYIGHAYPDKSLVSNAIDLIKNVLSQQKDNIALIQRVIEKEDDLYDVQDQLQDVESFFKTQVQLFDKAIRYEQQLQVDLDYIKDDQEANEALNRIRLITLLPPSGHFDYSRIPELNTLLATVKKQHDSLLAEKRKDQFEIVHQCLEEIHAAAGDNIAARAVSNEADLNYAQQKEKINETNTLALLEGYPTLMWNYRDNQLDRIKALTQPTPPKPKLTEKQQPPIKKTYKSLYLQSLLRPIKLESDADIDAYVERLRRKLKEWLKVVDGIDLK